MKLIVVLVAALAALALSPTAGAHLVVTKPVRTLDALEHRQSVNVAHARATLRWFQRRHLSLVAVRDRDARREYRWSYAAAVKPGWLVAQLARTREALRLRNLPSWEREPIVHEALWDCIHGNEGAWGAVNPNGHYNGLQMTWGWGPLVGDPNAYAPEQIYRAAEYEYRRSGYSSAWLQGQWGQTIGSCWSHAR